VEEQRSLWGDYALRTISEKETASVMHAEKEDEFVACGQKKHRKGYPVYAPAKIANKDKKTSRMGKTRNVATGGGWDRYRKNADLAEGAGGNIYAADKQDETYRQD